MADRLSIAIVVVGFAFMVACTSLIAYQNIRIAQIQANIIELIARTHPAVQP